MVYDNKVPLFGNAFNTVEPIVSPGMVLEQKIFEMRTPIPDVRTGVNVLEHRYSTPMERDSQALLNANVFNRNETSFQVNSSLSRMDRSALYQELGKAIATGNSDLRYKLNDLLNRL
ncbi:MAG: hypothetical protein KC589_06315 [Nanoarchaeota archaeon]|nr:hypothetical protein [Nanoarchaeota archaeon]